MSDANRHRMLTILERRGKLTTREQVMRTSLEELWDLYGFGAAATYECADWLAEQGLTHYEIDEWIRRRADSGVGDPRKSRDPIDYSYDAQAERRIYT